ncbi:MAG: PKD domain-containing protein [Actinobacteria bacterium]|nr:MAG: PKD domain-containing protein [Actinomycetota bacterium]
MSNQRTSLLLALAIICSLAVLASPASAARGLYAANVSDRTVSAYTVGATGAPTPVAGSPFDVGIAPVGVAMTPDAKYLYVTNLESNSIDAFAVGLNGGLVPLPGSPFAAGTGPWGVAVSPDGTHLYAANYDTSKVSAFSIAFDGSLSPLAGSPYASGGKNPNGIALTPDGKHLYATHMNSSNVAAFTVASDGSLSLVEGSPFAAGGTARPVSVTPDGKYLYVGNSTDNNIEVYSIGAEGALSKVTGSPFATEGNPLGLAITPDGVHLYTAHVGGAANIWGYSIGSNGALGNLSGSPFPTKAFRGNSATVSPDGRYLYSTNSGSNNISVFTIGAGGSLQSIAGSPFGGVIEPIQVVVSPDQGPVAAFSAAPTPAGNPLPLDGSASSDADGTLAAYRWDFGDGETGVTSSPTTTHVYGSEGDYTVTLTVVDDSGCSTAQTYTGQTVGCNGSTLAAVSHQVTVPPGEPLDVSLSGGGSGSVVSSPAGIVCPGTCSHFFEPGTEVTLNPGPAPGSAFAGWSGGGCEGLGKCQVTVDSESAVTATFAPLSPPPPADPPDHPGPAAIEPQLRILQVRGIPRKAKIVVRGEIASAASGAVSVRSSASVRGRRVGVSRQATIVAGRWRVRLPFPWRAAGAKAKLSLSVRFEGSPGVAGGFAERRLRVPFPTQ